MCAVHGAGAATGGSAVTRTGGCHGGGEGGRGGCGGTGQPARATGLAVVVGVVVLELVVEDGAAGCAGLPAVGVVD
jgi:hypothetical protein